MTDIIWTGDEHGRLLATQRVDKRDEESVRPFLQRMKDLGLDLVEADQKVGRRRAFLGGIWHIFLW